MMLTPRTLARLTAVAAALITASVAAQSISPAVFVTNNVGDSVTSFLVRPDGTLSRVGVFPSGDGPQTISLTPNGRYLAVANGTNSSTVEELRIFEVQADATLTHRLTTTVPDSPLDIQWLNDSILSVTDTSVGGSNFALTFNYDAVGNQLTSVDSEFTGAFNTQLATTRGGSLLYANNTLGTSSIYAFEATAGGQLSLLENQISSPLFAVGITATNDGNFLYGAGGISGNGNEILGYAISPTGSLDPLTPFTYASPGSSPKVLAFTADDRVMVAGHGTDATFWSFLRDPVSGALTATSNMFDIGLQGTLGDLKILGDLLFVTDESTALDGIAGIYAFRIHPDGSFSQLGPIQDTLGTRPEYIATWVGVPEPAWGLSVLPLALMALRRRREREARSAGMSS